MHSKVNRCLGLLFGELLSQAYARVDQLVPDTRGLFPALPSLHPALSLRRGSHYDVANAGPCAHPGVCSCPNLAQTFSSVCVALSLSERQR